MLELNKIYCMDAIEFMKQIDDKSVDMILCDLPYGTTQNKWDNLIPLDLMWKEMLRISRDNCAMVFTASQPFTSIIIISNIKMFKYEWIWDKKLSSGHLNASHQPMKRHESILVFAKSKTKYFPEMRKGRFRKDKVNSNSSNYGKQVAIERESDMYYPTSIIEFSNANRREKTHPTQKPVALFEYLIKTYTNEGDLVMDCVVGSGTTAVACQRTNRNFICNDNNADYVKIANQRLSQQPLLFAKDKQEVKT